MRGATVPHVTLADTRLSSQGPHAWLVRCVGCGWYREGSFRFSQCEPDALALAHAYGTEHEHTRNKTHEKGRTA